MNENLRRLRELMGRLPPEPGQRWQEYEVDGGVTFGFGMLKQPEVAVQRAWLSKGCTFPRHAHDVHEWLIVYAGRVVLDVDGERREMGMGDYVYLPPGQAHEVTVLENTWLLGVTIPADEGYPNAR